MIFDRIGSLFRHAAMYGAGDILGRAISVVLVPVYARMLTTEANGVRILGFTFVGFAAVDVGHFYLEFTPEFDVCLSKRRSGYHRCAYCEPPFYQGPFG